MGFSKEIEHDASPEFVILIQVAFPLFVCAVVASASAVAFFAAFAVPAFAVPAFAVPAFALPIFAALTAFFALTASAATLIRFENSCVL